MPDARVDHPDRKRRGSSRVTEKEAALNLREDQADAAWALVGAIEAQNAILAEILIAVQALATPAPPGP
jgi:hypothetical protein